MFNIPLWLVLLFLAIVLIGLIILSTPFIIVGYYFGGVLGGVAGGTVVPIGTFAYTRYNAYKSRQEWAARVEVEKAQEADGKKIEADQLVQQ
jgi:hypothetical protein